MSAVLAEADSHGTWLEPLFDVAFAAPGGVARLRQLILTLALQGKLVPQLAWETPASELRKQIEVSRAEQAKAENFRARKVNRPILSSEITFVLPDRWEWVRNGDLFGLRKGKVPKELNETGEIPYLDIEALDRGNIRRYTNDYSVPMCTDEDILVVCDGSRSGLVLKGRNGAIGSTLSVIETPQFIQPFVRLIFQQGFQRLNSSMKGAAIPHLDTKNLLQEVVGLPPLEEQQRIVARVYELLAHCDELERLHQQQCEKRAAARAATMRQWLTGDGTAAALLDKHFAILVSTREDVAELRKAILQLAVMGRLVAQDLANTPASELLKQVANEKAALVKAGKIRAAKALPPIRASEQPYAIPGGWEWVRLASISASIDYGTSQKTNNDSNLVPVYRMGNIVDGALINSNLKYISPVIDDLPYLYLQDGDILFNRTNSCELVGKSAIYSGESGVSTFASYLIRVRLVGWLLNSRFFSLAMNAPYFRETQIEPEIVQQCGQANFNGTKLSLCLLPLPPREEQERIVARIDALMHMCDTLEQSIDAAQAKQIELLDAVMAKV